MSGLGRKYCCNDGNNWVVRNAAYGQTKAFKFTKYGGADEALIEAMKWRDEQQKIIDDAAIAVANAKAEKERLEDEERAKMTKAQQKKEELRIRRMLEDNAEKESKEQKAKRLIVEEDCARFRECLSVNTEEFRRRDSTGDFAYIKHFAKYGNYDDFLPEPKGVDLLPAKYRRKVDGTN
jgi:hypothetical protein